jgi:hypothetical protein
MWNATKDSFNHVSCPVFFPIRQSYDAQFHLLIKYIIGVIQSYGLAEKSQEV